MARPDRTSLRDLLVASAQDYGDKLALAWSDGPGYSYRQVNDLALSLALRLCALSVRHGDRVGLLAENGPSWGVAYLGLCAAGFVVVPCQVELAAAQIESIIDHSQPKAFIVSKAQRSKLHPELGAKLALIELEDAVPPPDPEAEEGRQRAFSEADDLEADPVTASWEALGGLRPEDLAAIIYTSGTTGAPKGVMLSHANLSFEFMAAQSVQVLSRRDRFLSILPLAHCYECSIGFLFPYDNGCEIRYLKGPPSASRLMPALAKLRPTIMLSVPLVIEKIVRSSVFPKIPLYREAKAPGIKRLFGLLTARVAGKRLRRAFGNRLRFFGIGGAALAEDVEAFLKDSHFPYAIGYGMTEASPLIAGDRPALQKFRSTGHPLRGMELRIADSDGEGIGEIETRGPGVMQGYYRDPQLSAQCLSPDGWLKTGDLGRIGKGGRLYMRGRRKTMILGPSGENIYPEEIEALLDSQDFVEESMVFEDAEKGLTALVRLKPEVIEKIMAETEMAAKRIEGGVRELEGYAAEVLQGVKRAVNERLASFARLRSVVLRHEPLERNASRKLKRDVVKSDPSPGQSANKAKG